MHLIFTYLLILHSNDKFRGLSPGQTIATPQRSISQQCWPSICKLQPNDRNMLHAFGHPVAACFDTLGIENRTTAHAQKQHGSPGQTTTTSCNIYNCYIAGVFSRYSAPINWLVYGHMTSNNETIFRLMP